MVLFTAVLAGTAILSLRASNKLTKYTESLARFTEALARIETQREEHLKLHQRHDALRRALEIAEAMQRPEFSANMIGPFCQGRVPHPEVEYIRELALLRTYTDEIDTDCFQHLDYLRTQIDYVERGNKILDNTEVRKHIKALVERLQAWPINRWREEITGEKTKR